MATIEKGYTYAANMTVSAENLGALIMSATATLIDRSSVEQDNYTLATRGTSQPPGPYAGELWQDSTGPGCNILKSYRSTWQAAVPVMVEVENIGIRTWAQGTILSLKRDEEPTGFDVCLSSYRNPVGVSLETVAPEETGFIALHGVWPVLDDGSGSGIAAGSPVTVSDSVSGKAMKLTDSANSDQLMGYALTQIGYGDLPSDMFWCRFW